MSASSLTLPAVQRTSYTGPRTALGRHVLPPVVLFLAAGRLRWPLALDVTVGAHQGRGHLPESSGHGWVRGESPLTGPAQNCTWPVDCLILYCRIQWGFRTEPTALSVTKLASPFETLRALLLWH